MPSTARTKCWQLFKSLTLRARGSSQDQLFYTSSQRSGIQSVDPSISTSNTSAATTPPCCSGHGPRGRAPLLWNSALREANFPSSFHIIKGKKNDVLIGLATSSKNSSHILRKLKIHNLFDFILNQIPFSRSKILITGKNFGCGSSREHAVWALSDFGFKAILAPSFGDIFYSNSFKNGFLPIRLKNRDIDKLFELSRTSPGFKVTVNLDEQFIQTDGNEKFQFDIDNSLKNHLLKGLDDIALTLEYTKKIQTYEKNRSKITPWLFRGI